MFFGWLFRKTRRQRAFRPAVGGQRSPVESLETRQLLAAPALLGVYPPSVYQQYRNKFGVTSDGIPKYPKPYVQTGVANGGRAAAMVDVDGELYMAHLSNTGDTGGGLGPGVTGTIRAKAAPGGRVDLFLTGTTTETVLTIDPEVPDRGTETAHTMAPGMAYHDGLLHIRNITVLNGRIGQILAYRTADLNGKLTVQSRVPTYTTPFVDRIAFYRMNRGASIKVDGDINTLSIYDDLTLDGTDSVIQSNRDINYFYVGGNLTLVNGASMTAARDIGLLTQGAKGSAPGGRGGVIIGNLIVGTGSTIAAGRAIRAPIEVLGSSSGIANLQPQVAAATNVLGTRG